LQAACRLVEQLGGKIAGIAVLIELAFLKGRNKLQGQDLVSLLSY
jgi:adenine phosphoribosyltransferase